MSTGHCVKTLERHETFFLLPKILTGTDMWNVILKLSYIKLTVDQGPL